VAEKKQLEIPPLTPALIFLLALTTGVSVCTIYLNQPLLNLFAEKFHAPLQKVGQITTLTQIGYGLGILFLVPLGDVVQKKKLVILKLFLLALVLFATGLSSSLNSLVVGSLFIGLLASVAQDTVPLAADLAPDNKRGRIVGTVMSGLLLGILSSRILSGIIADALGWRAVFIITGGMVIGILCLLWFKLPEVPVKNTLKYRSLLKSMAGHFKDKPLLRGALVTHGLVAMAFSAFWTNLSFYLGKEPFNFSSGKIGLFGLAGAAGALMAPMTGKLVDNKGPFQGVLTGIFLVIFSFTLMSLAPKSVWILIFGAIVFDSGIQMSLISHQSIIYQLDSIARSRLNAVFFSGMFFFLAVGSFISVPLQSKYGWTAVLTLGILTSSLAFLNGLRQRRIFRNLNHRSEDTAHTLGHVDPESTGQYL
jgi:predicted MFS family arabinose efflux permease